MRGFSPFAKARKFAWDYGAIMSAMGRAQQARHAAGRPAAALACGTKSPGRACSTEAGICREISAGKIEFRSVSSPVQLAELQRLLRHGFFMMKAAAEANRTGDDDGKNYQDTHGFSPPLRISDDDYRGSCAKDGGISDTVENQKTSRRAIGK
jgi:hypothetical protein